MNKILTPTDYSSIADNAISYAIEIAASFDSKLYWYHVYAIKKADYDLELSDKEQPLRKKAEHGMEKTKQRFEEIISQKELSVKTKVYQQHYMDSLFGRTVKKDGIDLIVMGSKGASGINKVVFGSVAATALDTTKVPLLVVPPKFAFSPPKHIVLATDYKKIAQRVLSPLRKLAAMFGAKVTILNINTGSGNNADGIKDLQFNNVETAYREVPLSGSINESINRFIENENCDMLCMVKREKSFFESIFKKSVTKNQVYDTRVPLLVLPENYRKN